MEQPDENKRRGAQVVVILLFAVGLLVVAGWAGVSLLHPAPVPDAALNALGDPTGLTAANGAS